jgi:hypothetical protein
MIQASNTALTGNKGQKTNKAAFAAIQRTPPYMIKCSGRFLKGKPKDSERVRHCALEEKRRGEKRMANTKTKIVDQRDGKTKQRSKQRRKKVRSS